MITDTINILLATDATVTGYVGTNIFQDIASQDDLKNYISIHLIDINPERIKGSITMDVSRIQVNVYNKNKHNADLTAAAIRSRLEQFRNVTGYGDKIDKIMFDDISSGEYDEILRVYTVYMDFIVRSHQL